MTVRAGTVEHDVWPSRDDFATIPGFTVGGSCSSFVAATVSGLVCCEGCLMTVQLCTSERNHFIVLHVVGLSRMIQNFQLLRPCY